MSEKKIMDSLSTAKILGAGQSLRTLAKIGFWGINDSSIEQTKRILQKLKRQDVVCYVGTTKVWVLR